MMSEENQIPDGGSYSEGDSGSLEDQLTALKIEKDTAFKKQVDTNLVELEKLIDDAQKANESYRNEYGRLKIEENNIKSERDKLFAALAAALGTEGVEQVKNIVGEKADEVKQAEESLQRLTTALLDAEKASEEAELVQSTLKTKLDIWKKPVENISERLGSAQKIITEIQKLRNSNKRGEAYWKLALAELAEIPGLPFLDEELKREPQLIEPDQLQERFRKIWNDLTNARSTAAEKMLELERAKVAQKDAETKLKNTTTNLIKAITDTLAEREAAGSAA